MSDFYYLSHAHKPGALQMSMSFKIYDDVEVVQGRYTGESITLEYLKGKRVYDIIGCGWGYIHAVSPAFLSVLRENNFTGWKSYPIEYNNKKYDLTGYEILGFTGTCGDIKNELSVKRMVPPVVPWSNKDIEAHFGLFFEPESWDGSDLFTPANSYQLFITQRVKEALENAGLVNIEITHQSEVENVDLMI